MVVHFWTEHAWSTEELSAETGQVRCCCYQPALSFPTSHTLGLESRQQTAFEWSHYLPSLVSARLFSSSSVKVQPKASWKACRFCSLLTLAASFAFNLLAVTSLAVAVVSASAAFCSSAAATSSDRWMSVWELSGLTKETPASELGSRVFAGDAAKVIDLGVNVGASGFSREPCQRQ